MKFDENLAAVHAYLCSDGYVMDNPMTRKRKNYIMGFRNTNEMLLKDFQNRFYSYFRIKPKLNIGERCIIYNKQIHQELINSFTSFYSKEWKMPVLNKKLTKTWLRAFFDCEGWVFCKTHQNRHIGLDSINEKGLDDIIKALNEIGIKSIKKENKKRQMFRIIIYGKENLIKFKEEIGFLHPSKKNTLDLSINDYVNYNWKITKDKDRIRKIMLEKSKVKKPYIIRIISKEKNNLDNLSKYLRLLFSIESIKINEKFNGIGTRYFELNINRKSEVEKLMKHKLINEEQLNKMDKIKIC